VLRRFRPRLNFANVVSVIALFVALGGGAYAAFHLPRNSVRSKNLVNHQVKSVDLAREAAFKSAGLADDEVGDCSPTPNQWVSIGAQNVGPVGYQRDQLGYVHLGGVAEQCGDPASAVIFTLPPGYRPKQNHLEPGLKNSNAVAAINVQPGGNVVASPTASGDTVDLNGVTFRCAPSGKNGCP
jgi:hypothetical protein